MRSCRSCILVKPVNLQREEREIDYLLSPPTFAISFKPGLLNVRRLRSILGIDFVGSGANVG